MLLTYFCRPARAPAQWPPGRIDPAQRRSWWLPSFSVLELLSTSTLWRSARAGSTLRGDRAGGFSPGAARRWCPGSRRWWLHGEARRKCHRTPGPKIRNPVDVRIWSITEIMEISNLFEILILQKYYFFRNMLRGIQENQAKSEMRVHVGKYQMLPK